MEMMPLLSTPANQMQNLDVEDHHHQSHHTLTLAGCIKTKNKKKTASHINDTYEEGF